MAVTGDDVRHLANLARLSLSPAEVAGLAAQLGQILDHIEALEDGQGNGPAAAEDRAAGDVLDPVPLRPDEPSVEPPSTPPGSMAPAWVDGFYTVPRASHRPPGAGA